MFASHRHRLGREDLEDCYSQATLELLTRARRGEEFADAVHIAKALEQKFLSRIHDRRRALSGRSPIQAALASSLPLIGGAYGGGADVADARADVERLTFLRHDLRSIARLSRELSSDQRLVLASELSGEQDLPYGPDGHPDPLGAPDEDCSSTVNYVLYRSGIRPLAEILRENPLAQDYVNWGDPGQGRWVTIYATTEPTDHVFIVIAGLRLDTSYKGTDIGPNRDEGGPRWRILDHIPTWAHWSVRHPPGL
jgi:hypothetical protein